jgi:hypothetical protein
MDICDGPTVPYVLGGENLRGLDCQGLIEYVVRTLGGRMSYRGSNDMYRNACTITKPLRGNKPERGCVLFIVRAGESGPGYDDGLGNASHVGWYTGGRHEVVHASSSRGKVAPSTIKNGWTHIGWLKAVDYTESGGDMAKAIVSYGDKGSRVTEMQAMLMRLGYPLPKFGADGDFGKETLAALVQFQQKQGLPVVDYCDVDCWTLLVDMAGEPDEDAPDDGEAFTVDECLAGIAEAAQGVLDWVDALRKAMDKP